MSFQGAATGISGTINQFSAGYAQSTANSSYAGSAGNINGYAPQAGYANQATVTSQTLQLTSIQGNTQWGWQGQQSNPSHLWGSNQGSINTVFNPGALQVSYSGYAGSAGNINGYAPQAGYANQSAGSASNIQSSQGINGTNWAWSGQGGTPGHLWGGNVANQYAVWAPNQMYVGQAGYAGYAGSAGNINGYAPASGYSNQLAIQQGGGTATTWAWSGQGGTPNHFWGSNQGSYMAVWQAGQMTAGYSNNTYINYGAVNSGFADTTGQTYIAYNIQGGYYNIGTGNQGGIITDGNGIGFCISGIVGCQWRQGAFYVSYNPENNYSQYLYFTNSWGTTSDIREKDDIVDLDFSDAHEFIKQLRPRKFKWKKERLEKHQEGKEDGEMCGFIAQEVLAAASNTHTVFHNILNGAKDYLKAGGHTDITKKQPPHAHTLGVSHEVMVAPLVKTIQKAMQDVNNLKDRVNKLKPKFNIT